MSRTVASQSAGSHALAIGTLVLVAAAPLTGCSEQRARPAAFPAGGRVLVDGRPTADIHVTFTPAIGPAAAGKTDSEGRFQLGTHATSDGALAGDHRVTFTFDPVLDYEPGDEGSPKYFAELAKHPSPFPDRFGRPEESGHTATVVAGGENDFTFDLPGK